LENIFFTISSPNIGMRGSAYFIFSGAISSYREDEPSPVIFVSVGGKASGPKSSKDFSFPLFLRSVGITCSSWLTNGA
jgi:hypothetical protein